MEFTDLECLAIMVGNLLLSYNDPEKNNEQVRNSLFFLCHSIVGEEKVKEMVSNPLGSDKCVMDFIEKYHKKNFNNSIDPEKEPLSKNQRFDLFN